MTQTEKAERYDYLVREGDKVQFQLSKLKSQNAGINTKSDEYNVEVGKLQFKMDSLEREMSKLFS